MKEEISHASYISLTHMVLTQTVRAKIFYSKHQFESIKNNIKSTLELTNCIMGRVRKTNRDLSFQDDNSLITNFTQISNLFNSDFSQVGIKLSNELPHQNQQPVSYCNFNERPSNAFRSFFYHSRRS